MKGETMTTITIKLEEKQDTWLNSMAEYTGQSKAEIINEMIETGMPDMRLRYMFEKVSQEEESKTCTVSEWLEEIGFGDEADDILKEVEKDRFRKTHLFMRRQG